MPYIEAKFFEGRLDDAKSAALIEGITDALAAVFGDDVRRVTWVVLEEVPRTRWGIDGKPAG
jgi:4-oxalocrotonate tautomerase